MALYLNLKQILGVLAVSFAMVVLSSCASEVPPQGGPEDKTPPKILRVSPDSGTTKFRGSKIRLQFDKYMTTSSLKPALFFSPSIDDYEIEWNGKEADIIIYDTLKADRTYSYTLTQALTDLRGNKLKASYSFAFSTGNTIDSGSFGGKVYGFDNRTAKANLIIAYLHPENDSVFVDTLNPARAKPDYIAQTDDNGDFKFQYLKAGKYRIFAVVDKNQNTRYDAGESFGVPLSEVRTGDKAILMRLTSAPDTSRMELQSASAKTQNEVGLRFDRNLFLDSLKIDCFSIFDSTAKRDLKVYDFFINTEAGRDIVYLITENLNKKNLYRINATNLTDQYGNHADTLFAVFNGTDQIDTTKLIFKSALSDSSKNILEKVDETAEGRLLPIEFSRGISRGSLDSALSLGRQTSAGVQVLPSKIIFRDSKRLFIKPINGFELGAWYRLTVNYRLLRDAFGKAPAQDTLIRIHFQIAEKDLFGELEGTVYADTATAILISVEAIGEQRFYKVLVRKKAADSAAAFRFESLPEGKYFLSAFVPKMIRDSVLGQDSTLSQYRLWDAGKLKPYRAAERFTLSFDSLRVRKRWTTDGAKLSFPK
jgi:hypothetical protein